MLAKVAKFRQIWSHCLDSKQPTLLNEEIYLMSLTLLVLYSLYMKKFTFTRGGGSLGIISILN